MSKKKQSTNSGTAGSPIRAIFLIFLGAAIATGVFMAKSRIAATEDSSVDEFLDRYFTTWSENDMDGYAKCFHPKARIHYYEHANILHSYKLAPFIKSQKDAHNNSKVDLREIPLEKRINVKGNMGQAYVTWKLFQGSKVSTGVDLFTLIKTDDGWKIIELVFQNDS